MTYRVRVTQRARQEIDELIDYIARQRQEPMSAERVLQAIWDAIPTLETHPHRCPLAPENAFTPETVRMLIVKRSLLLLYVVDDDQQLVTVKGFRHGSRQPLDLSAGDV